jgi:vacuolar-type H+-ATPase subunit F/Vma7
MARLTMVAPSDLVVGFRLAGTDVVGVASPAEAERALTSLAADPEVGVIGVSAELLDAMDPQVRERFEGSVAPVIVAVPSGAGAPGDHRARLASLLQRAIGFRISFGGEET